MLEIVRREAIGAGGSLHPILMDCSVAPLTGGPAGSGSVHAPPFRVRLLARAMHSVYGSEPASVSCIWRWLMGIGLRARWAGLTAVSCRRDPVHLPWQGPRDHYQTHARKGEAPRHRGGHTCGDREPMLVRGVCRPWRGSISGGLVMLAERR